MAWQAGASSPQGPSAAQDEPLVRIAICGAGISGLTLAGILSRTLAAGTAVRPKITVFERASADRDQGYGLDLDESGQEALARAGVFHRYFDMSYPRSDSMAFFKPHGQEPFFIKCSPKWCARRFPGRPFGAARLETNRGKLRDVLLEAVQERGNTEVLFETAVSGLRCDADGPVTLLGGDGQTLGSFDLVVDGMGLHSTLRHYRVTEPGGLKKHYEGLVMVHGVVQPEVSFSPKLRERFGPFGTLNVLGRGYSFTLQRFGAGAGDHRTSLMYVAPRPADGAGAAEDELFAEMGVEKPTSRAGGIMSDEARLDATKAWLKRDIGQALDPLYLDAVDALERITVRASVTHGPEVSLRQDHESSALPLLCIGDSLRNIGVGGGGILAMQDAIELSKALAHRAAFDPSGQPNMQPLREAEAKMLLRKQRFYSGIKQTLLRLQRRRDAEAPALTWEDVFRVTWQRWLARLVLPPLARAFTRWFWADHARGEAGSDERSPIYKNVTEYLHSEEEAQLRRWEEGHQQQQQR